MVKTALRSWIFRSARTSHRTFDVHPSRPVLSGNNFPYPGYCVTQLKPYTLYKLRSPIFCCRWGIGNTRPNLHFFQYIQAYKHLTDPIQFNTKPYRVILTQHHRVPASTAPSGPSTTKYQPVTPHTDQVPPSTSQYRPLLSHFHQVPTSTALYWPSITKYQTVTPHTDQVPPE